ncbi:integrase family protein [Glaciecola sp. KUL10]|nr:integrase family protein [Glaciecola sp. KUL10]
MDLARQQAIHFFGKGRNERIVPMWSQTITELKRWLLELPHSPTAALIPNRHGAAITRFGVKQRLDCAVKKARQACPSLKNRHISPHSIRHTTAMHLLQSGVDMTVIALWLGHAKLETTHQYMQADIEMKREALAKLPSLPTAF